MDLLNENLEELLQKAINPMWALFKQRYETAGLEKGDFVNTAFLALKKELPKYDPEKSSICTFATVVLRKRMTDHLRDNFNTDKTRANFCCVSLNTPVSANSETEKKDLLVGSSGFIPISDKNTIKRFMHTLSNQQKEILLLKIIGLDPKEIQYVMDMPKKEYQDNMEKIQNPRRSSILRNEVI